MILPVISISNKQIYFNKTLCQDSLLNSNYVKITYRQKEQKILFKFINDTTANTTNPFTQNLTQKNCDHRITPSRLLFQIFSLDINATTGKYVASKIEDAILGVVWMIDLNVKWHPTIKKSKSKTDKRINAMTKKTIELLNKRKKELLKRKRQQRLKKIERERIKKKKIYLNYQEMQFHYRKL